MSNYFLFSDASLNPQLKIGVGGYVVVPESYIRMPLNLIEKSELDEMIVLRRFRETSSTKLEIQTVLWALGEYCNKSTVSNSDQLHIYSDSQCVAGLLSRRPLLEGNGFHSRRGSHILKNASLYVEYYKFHDRLKFKVVKVSGHARNRSHNTNQRIFSFVDQKVRKTLKRWVARIETEKDEWSL